MNKTPIQYVKIKGFENYTISNYGTVLLDGKEISQSNNGNGYLFVRLRKDGKRYNRYVHRLVYENFIGEIKYEINHKDHKKDNNFVENLEDISHKQNMNCAEKQYGKYYLKNMNQPRCGIINQYDINGKLVNSFTSVKMAAQWIVDNGYSKKTNNVRSIVISINRHLSNKMKTNVAYGYIWKEE